MWPIVSCSLSSNWAIRRRRIFTASLFLQHSAKGGRCMPARTGVAYLQGLRARHTEVWLGSERRRDVTAHPALRRAAHSVAHLYDMQHDPALHDEMTYVSPTSGDRVGLSFLTPRALDD